MTADNEALVTQFFLFLGGILTTWLTLRYKDRIALRNREQKPKERMDTIFDGYESLIKQQQLDIDRKSKQLDNTQLIIERLQDELDETKKIVQAQQQELKESRAANKDLVKQLAEMKQHYRGATK